LSISDLDGSHTRQKAVTLYVEGGHTSAL